MLNVFKYPGAGGCASATRIASPPLAFASRSVIAVIDKSVVTDSPFVG